MLPALTAVPRRSHLGAVAGFLLCVLLPAALAAGYWYGIATDRYVSELRYAIRGGPGLEMGESASGPAASLGLSAAGSDGFILEDYLRSAAAVEEVEAQLPLRQMLARDGEDPVRRFDPAMPTEALVDYWNAAIDLRFDVLTGITTLEVALYRAEDSLAVAEALVGILRALVDRLSERQQNEMLAYVDAEYATAETRLRDSLDAIEAFRRRTRTVSPTDEAALATSTIAQLTAELTSLTVRRRTLAETVPNSPQIPRLDEQMTSLRAQIASTRALAGGQDGRGESDAEAGDPRQGRAWDSGLGSGTPGLGHGQGAGKGAGIAGTLGSVTGALPGQLTDFERLQNEYQIALDAYVATLGLRQQARAAATLGRVHLAVFVPPRAPVSAMGPDRAGSVATVGVIAFLLWVVGRILLASLRTP
ncbi:MAG: hypothetical protein AAFV86_09445 [Pseudomonadota bacterium]